MTFGLHKKVQFRITLLNKYEKIVAQKYFKGKNENEIFVGEFLKSLIKNERKVQNEILNNISELDNTKFTKEEIEKGFYEIQKDKNSVEKEQVLVKESKQKIENEIKNIYVW